MIRIQDFVFRKGLNPSNPNEPFIRGAPTDVPECYIPVDAISRPGFTWPTVFGPDLKCIILCMQESRRCLYEPVEYCPDLKEHIMNYLDHFSVQRFDRSNNKRVYTIVKLSIKIFAVATWQYHIAKEERPSDR